MPAKKAFKSCALLGALLTLSAVAQAAVVNRSYNFQTGHFSGSFSLQFDNASNVANTSNGVSLLSLSTDLVGWDGAYQPAFHDIAGGDVVVFGFRGNYLINAARDDLLLAFRGASTDTPTLTTAQYQWFSNGQTARNDTRISLTSTVTSAVPEPGSLALVLAAALAGTGGAALRRR